MTFLKGSLDAPLGELGARTVLGLLPETEPQGLKRIGIWNQTYKSVPKYPACLTGSTCFTSGELSSEASSSSLERIDRFQLFFAVLLGRHLSKVEVRQGNSQHNVTYVPDSPPPPPAPKLLWLQPSAPWATRPALHKCRWCRR